ncbi:hypothetical protein [Paenibacillus kobensis]|uniref:hypothetical protein n=1 Tax=Paenibacillus kobensis TaxID=59841 RepID=UPI000FDADC8E|nr:hypothetical protein [Paenibacillus kobensis]
MTEWHVSYKTEMEHVFRIANERIEQYPSPFREQALDYMNRFNPIAKESTKNYICYLLPYWVREAAGNDQQSSRRLSVANVFVMLYFFIQDDLMDNPPAGWKHQLALGNLFQTTYSDLYRELFPSDSPFWRYHRQYVEEWSLRVTSAQERNCFEYAPESLAGKASPVKLASTGAMLLGGQDSRIEEVSGLIDRVLATLQMVDDWMDWEEDLHEESDNSLIDMIRQQQQLSMKDTVTPELANRCLFTTDVMSQFYFYVSAQHETLLPHRSSFPHLIAFHQSLLVHLQEACSSIAARKQSLLRGGFIHYLSGLAK